MERLDEWNSAWLKPLSETEVRVTRKALKKLGEAKELPVTVL